MGSVHVPAADTFFRVASITKVATSVVAMRMADEKVFTVDAAEAFFSRDGAIYTGIRNVLSN